MKTFFTALLFMFYAVAFGQSYIPSGGQVFQTINDLKNHKGTPGIQVRVNGRTTVNDGDGGGYLWDASSVTTADDFLVVQVSGVTTGRWIRLKNSANMTSGTSVFSGIALQNQYVVTHGLGFTPVKIIITPRSADASNRHYVDNITSTTFRITFISVPLIGTNNIRFDWIAVKQ